MFVLSNPTCIIDTDTRDRQTGRQTKKSEQRKWKLWNKTIEYRTWYSNALRLERLNVPHTRTDLTVASRESGDTMTCVAVDAVHTGATIFTE